MNDERNLQPSDLEKNDGQNYSTEDILYGKTEDTLTENLKEEFPETENNYSDIEGNSQSPYGYNEEEGYENAPDYENRNPQGNREIPRWNPNQEDYSAKPPQPKKKKKAKYALSIIVGVIILAAAIVAGVVIGVDRVHRMEVKRDAMYAQTGEDNGTAKITTASSEAAKDISSEKKNGYVLTDVSGIVDGVLPSVVSITSRSLVDTYSDYFSYFFGNRNNSNNSGEKKEIESGLGSGTIISQNDDELLILTSYHVVDNCSSLYVTFMDDSSVDGYVKSADEGKDIAIVAVPLSDISEDTLNYIKIATLSTEKASVGEGVIVIGNALGYGMSVTTGIVSATDRELTVSGKTLNVLQTDAAINEGNSGGCMLNAKGEVIGISEAKIIVTSVEGMCYAIPIYDNAGLIENLLNVENKQEETAPTQGAYLGIQGRDVSSYNAEKYGMPEGIYVAGTVRGGGADLAGIKKGDIIVSIDGRSSETMSELKDILSGYNPGDIVTVIVMRENVYGYDEIQLDVTLTEVLS